MPLVRVKIENFKSIESCDIALSELNLLLGENGTGKTSILEAIRYFYDNLTKTSQSDSVFNQNNKFSNEVRITLFFDMSFFEKISKSNFDVSYWDEGEKTDRKYVGYYKTILSLAAKRKSKILPITLSQVKGHRIRWDYSFEERFIIKSLFPVYFLDTRNLDITKWHFLWEALGELGKASHEERKSIESGIHDVINRSNEVSHKLSSISNVFDAADVSIKRNTSKEFAKNLSRLFFSGDQIYQSGKKLDYYSPGTNSVKYIELVLRVIEEISKTKLKEPIVLLDEPEIGLHPLYMDELSEAIVDSCQKTRILLSTHSSRLTKNLITSDSHTQLYNVKLINKQSCIQKMRLFPHYSPESKYRVTDDHINSYFSRAILFVEGETELELFANPYLKALFPQLKYIDVFKAMSESPVLNIMNPSKAQSHIPYLCLIDLDKIFSYNPKAHSFSRKEEYFKAAKKEAFHFRSKHESNTFLQHQEHRIAMMLQKLKVHYLLPFYSCKDPAFFEMRTAIHDYLLSYNIFTFNTTVEGALINSRTLDLALGFLSKAKSARDYAAFFSYQESLLTCDRLNVLRLVFNGKSDLLISYKALANKYKLPQQDKEIIDRTIIGGKTSGWVSDYLLFYFQKDLNIDHLSPQDFARYVSNAEQRKDIIIRFQFHFPELLSLIEKICGMINL